MIFSLNLRRSALTLAVLALSGCSFIPTYERPAAPVAAEWSGVAPVAAETPAADVAWVDFVIDARLRELIGLAIRNNRDLRVATLNIERVRAQYQIQRANQFPTIGVAASGTVPR